MLVLGERLTCQSALAGFLLIFCLLMMYKDAENV
jgi:hypothetical protein